MSPISGSVRISLACSISESSCRYCRQAFTAGSNWAISFNMPCHLGTSAMISGWAVATVNSSKRPSMASNWASIINAFPP